MSVPEACNFIKKQALTQVSSCELGEFFKNAFFIEHLQKIASELYPISHDSCQSKITHQRKRSLHMETSQSNWTANQLTGFCMTGTHPAEVEVEANTNDYQYRQTYR